MVPAAWTAGPSVRVGQPRDELGPQVGRFHDGVDHEVAGHVQQVDVGALLGGAGGDVGGALSPSPMSAILLAYMALTEASAAIGPISAVGSAIVARGSKPGAHMA